jgi:hypothetical protein
MVIYTIFRTGSTDPTKPGIFARRKAFIEIHKSPEEFIDDLVREKIAVGV